MSFGLDNITDVNQSGMNESAFNLSVSQAEKMVGDVGAAAGGSFDIIGFFLLFIFAFALYKSNVSLDVSAAMMIPTLFVLARFDLLPGGSGVLYGITLSIAGLFAFGLYRYFR